MVTPSKWPEFAFVRDPQGQSISFILAERGSAPRPGVETFIFPTNALRHRTQSKEPTQIVSWPIGSSPAAHAAAIRQSAFAQRVVGLWGEGYNNNFTTTSTMFVAPDPYILNRTLSASSVTQVANDTVLVRATIPADIFTAMVSFTMIDNRHVWRTSVGDGSPTTVVLRGKFLRCGTWRAGGGGGATRSHV